MINIIAAVARNRAIGYQNKLLYWLPNDMRRFRKLTTGNTVIMGRRTFESLPNGPLPNRRNVVLTHSNLTIPGVDICGSFDEVIFSTMPDETLFIIGGANIYSQSMHLADRLLLTEVEDIPAQADAFFPDYSEWKLISKEWHPADERHAFAYSFTEYVKGD